MIRAAAISASALLASVWALTSFVVWDVNPADWPMDARLFAVLIGVSCACVIVPVLSTRRRP